ncbi:hypothetical protein ACJJTC_009445 [Scirpophaga incertulas]
MKIKFSEGTEREENEKLMKNHQKRAEKVYDKKSTDRVLSIETRDTVVLAFDLQQCLPTPYLKSGAAFYKRPLWTYNLTLRDCTTNTVYCFMSHEAIGGRGHTHMDCDVDHAAIERAKKKTSMDIHHPRDWYQLVRSCGKKNKFTVIEMHSDLFLDFASLLKGPLQQKKID